MGEGPGVDEIPKASPRQRPAPGWWVLGLLLLATLASSFFISPGARPPVGDEVTVAMAAASLAWDRDLAWSSEDSQRFAEQWGARPDRLRLQAQDGGFSYATPVLHALVSAPLVRLAPVRGVVILNALLLAAAALLTARALSLHLGGMAPIWVAVLLFASVAFAYVFRVQPDVFLMAATAAGFALVYGGGRSPRRRDEPLPDMYEPEPAARTSLARWLAAGALLAIPATVHPLYLLLLVPALLAAARWKPAVAVGLGAAALLGTVLWSQGSPQEIRAAWGDESRVYDVRSGTPREDRQSGAKEEAGLMLHPRLAGWNGLYFLAGRHVGVLPYFLPLFLGFAAYHGDRGRWALLLAVLAVAAGFLLLRPFDFIGGEGAIANRLFLPLYAALWFLAARPARVLPALVVTVLAAPFLYVLWSHPATASLAGERAYTSPVAGRWLPYETTQRHAPGRALFQNSLWIKLLDRDLWSPRGADSLRLVGGAELLAGSSLPVAGFVLEFDANAPSRLEIGGEELRPVLLRPDGSIAFELPAGEARAVHPLWWSRGENYYLYDLDFRLPGAPAGPIRFRVLPRRDFIQRSAGEGS